jgi:predicted MFS family arabinose efflux permease
MIIPGLPLAGLVALLFVVTLVGAPFSSARAAIFPDVLTGDKYVLGTTVTITTYQFAQVIGFATGGAVITFFGTRTSLVVDAVTFLASALIVRVWVRPRPVPANAASGQPGSSWLANLFAGARMVFGHSALRTPVLFGFLAAFYNAPEGVAAPLAKALGGGAATIGLILAANSLGETTGAIVVGRFLAPPKRLRLMGPLAVTACAVLILFLWKPDRYASLVILFASGLCASYQLAANAAFVSAAPMERRSQAFGLAQGGMSLGQGTVMIVAGAAAQHYASARVIAVCGAIGALAALTIVVSSTRDHDGPALERHQQI